MSILSSVVIPSRVAALLLLAAGTAAADTPHTVESAPMAAVGVLSGGDPTDHHCSASIVDSPRGSVIVTAAHCVYGKQSLAFSPSYHDGQAPYGTWRAVGVYVWDAWKDHRNINGVGSPFDYAFVVLHRLRRRSVGSVE